MASTRSNTSGGSGRSDRPVWASGGQAALTVRGLALDVLVLIIVLPSPLAYLHREGQQPTALTLVALFVTTAPILARRLWPLPVFVWIFVAGIAAVALISPPLPPGLSVLAALYTVAAQCTRRQALICAGVLEASGLVLCVQLQGSGWWYAGIFLTGLVTAALGLGLYSATRRAYLAELQERARRLEFERDQQVELAEASERARIAREIHDIVAHHLTVIVALSDGMVASPSAGPDRVAQVMTAVSATGRQALTDTRRLLGVLRDDHAPEDGDGHPSARQPVPNLSGIDALIESVRSAGLPIGYQVTGATSGLPPAVQLTAYRIVQEALTNTLKHAGPRASAKVELTRLDGELRLLIQDDGRGVTTGVAGAAGTGGAAGVPGVPGVASGMPGRGLTGMRERVQAFDGELSTGPAPERGWRVIARLPLAPEPT